MVRTAGRYRAFRRAPCRAGDRPQDSVVRASSANEALWWIVGVMAVFTLLRFVAGDPEARDMLRYTVAIAGTVAVGSVP
jgi:hypothetical protein